MALNTTGSSGLSDEMKTFYDRVLLKRALPVLLFDKFGQKKRIPKRGGKTIEFRKFASLATATTPLTEGALYTNLKDLTVTAINATIAQYGDAVGFSDLVSTTTFDPVLTESSEILGEQAGETIDEVIRDILVAGTTVQYAGSATSRATIAATDILDVAEVREAALTLKLNRAKKINGWYHAIIDPRTEFDLISTTEWQTANSGGERTGRMIDGSIGQLYGVKFWVTDKVSVLTDAGVTTVDVYQSLFFGANAYGIVDLAGHNLRSIYHGLGSSGAADPLDQQQTMGWKAGFTAKILNDAFMVRVEHATSTGSNT